MVDPKQGYNDAKCEKPRFNHVRKTVNDKVLSNQKRCQLSPLNMRESKKKNKKKWCYIQDLLDELNSQTKHQINRIRT